MKVVGLVVVCVLIATGCKKAEGSECGSAIDGLLLRLHTDAKPGPDLDEARSNFKAVVANRCTEDKWGSETLSCLETATTEDQIKACEYKHLSQEQQDKVNRATAWIDLGGRQARTAAVMKDMTGFADKMCACQNKKCSDGVQDAMNVWSAKHSDRNDKADEQEMKKLSGIADRYAACMVKAIALDVDDSGIPRACRDLAALYDNVQDCDRLPRATRDALKESVKKEVADWKAIPATGREALAEECRAAIPQLQQSLAPCN